MYLGLVIDYSLVLLCLRFEEKESCDLSGYLYDGQVVVEGRLDEGARLEDGVARLAVNGGRLESI
jgi:hypothetical protein